MNDDLLYMVRGLLRARSDAYKRLRAALPGIDEETLRTLLRCVDDAQGPSQIDHLASAIIAAAQADVANDYEPYVNGEDVLDDDYPPVPVRHRAVTRVASVRVAPVLGGKGRTSLAPSAPSRPLPGSPKPPALPPGVRGLLPGGRRS